MKPEEQERLNAVNEFIKVIASCGRCFFSENSDKQNKLRYPFISFMEVDQRGRVWFTDHYTHQRIYTHYDRQWKYFTSGGTLRSMVELFRDHIKKGVQMRAEYFDPYERGRDWSHPWAYGDDLAIVKREAIRLGIAISEGKVE